jgi:hypothetical protein
MQNANGYKRWVSCGAHAGLCSLVYSFSPSSGSHLAKMSYLCVYMYMFVCLFVCLFVAFDSEGISLCSMLAHA